MKTIEEILNNPAFHCSTTKEQMQRELKGKSSPFDVANANLDWVDCLNILCAMGTEAQNILFAIDAVEHAAALTPFTAVVFWKYSDFVRGYLEGRWSITKVKETRKYASFLASGSGTDFHECLFKSLSCAAEVALEKDEMERVYTAAGAALWAADAAGDIKYEMTEDSSLADGANYREREWQLKRLVEILEGAK